MADTGNWNNNPAQNAENWKNQERPEVSVSLDDVIAEERAQKKQNYQNNYNRNQYSHQPVQQQTWDYAQYSTAQIKEQLRNRGCSEEGTREELVASLKNIVNEAWNKYYAEQKAWGTGAPPKKKRTGKKRPRMTEEERAEFENQRMEARKAKLARKAENKRKMEEDRERKRQKKEAKAAKQREMEQNQKKEKERRQRSEAFVRFDMKSFEKVVRMKLDPSGQTIKSCSYDFAKKGFKVTFNDPEYMDGAASGSSYRNPKKINMQSEVSIFPSPLESCCVFFLYPAGKTHPSLAQAEAWVEQKATGLSELQILDVWCQSALDFENTYGTILNVYRERGFMIIHFASPEKTEQFVQDFSDKGDFNGVPFVYLNKGTPTKKDKQQCTKLVNNAMDTN